jgi:MFS family permease
MPSPAASESSPPSSARAALAVGEFRLYLLTTFALTTAMTLQATALGKFVFDLTRSEFMLGLTGLAEALPSIAVILFAGHFADRRDRRGIVVRSTFALVVCSVLFWWIAARAPQPTAGEPSAVDASTGVLFGVYALIFATGLARGALQPARTALGTDIVPREVLSAAIGLRTTFWQIGMVTGPLLGGVLYDLGGAPAAFAADAALVAVAYFAATRLKRRPPPPRATDAQEPILASLRSGVSFVFSRRDLLGALTLDLFAVLFGGATALLPKFAADILHVDDTGFGMLRAAQSVGAILCALVLIRGAAFRRAGRAMLLAVAAFGAATIGFALSESFWLSCALLAAVGAADYVSVVVRHTLVQTRTPREMLGRVSAVNSVFIGSSNEIGAFESGVAATLMGTVPSVVFGGCMSIAVVIAVALRFPELRKLGALK